MLRRPRFASAVPIAAWLMIALSCALPLGWLCLQIASNPRTLRLLHPDAIRWDILGRTCGFSAVAALIAVVLALPPAVVVGLRRSRLSGLIAFSLPITLLLPSLMYAYGWAQFFRLAAPLLGRIVSAMSPDPRTMQDLGLSILVRDGRPLLQLTSAGPADVTRCILSLAAWLWPLPAAAMAWALRRGDPAVRQQAMLDGGAGRVALRQMLPAAIVGMLAVWILASQEFAVYEPTGISVVATEVRMVFETGSFSSAGNPITAPMGGAMFAGTDAGPNITAPLAPTLAMPAGGQDVQQRAAAAAVATGVPMLALTAVMGLIVAYACGRWSAEGDEVFEQAPVGTRPPRRAAATPPVDSVTSTGAAPPQPSALSLARRTRGPIRSGTGILAPLLALAVVLITVGVPIVAMIVRHQRRFDVPFIWQEFEWLVLGSLLNATLAAACALLIAMAGAQRRARLTAGVAVASFLVGGQLLAIALIRLYNREHLGWVYNAPPIMVMAYLGRFGWLVLLAAGATWSRPWRLLRQQAALDGAGPAATACRVVWPLAWPLLLGAAVLLLVLSMTEVPATVLVSPLRPLPPIIPMLMTWVHTLESDPMIEASLLLVGVAIGLGSVGVGLMRLGHRARRWRSEGDVV